MNHTSIENAWTQFKKFQNMYKPKTPTPNSSENSYFGNGLDPLNNFVNAWDNHHEIQQVQEDYKVGKIVKDVYFTMFPEKEGETYPANWILSAIGNYRQIRKERAKKLKTKEQDAMKGLKMHVVAGCILRCQLIHDNVNIPLPVLIQYMNKSLNRSQEKKQRQTVTLEAFETYRTDAKKGIKTYLKKVLPKCYNDLDPENLIDFTGYSILRFEREDVMKARRIARHVWNNGSGDFPDTTSPSIVAIGALFTVCMIKNMNVDYTLFGLSKVKLGTAYRTILRSENPKVQKELVPNMISPTKAMETQKSSTKKYPKKASVKV